MQNILWPEVDDLYSAKKACIQASSAALLVGAVTGIVAFYQSRGTPLLEGVSSASYIDSAIFLLLTFFIYRGSRIAAIAGLVLHAYGQFLVFQQTHRAPMTGIIFSLFFLSGVRGALAYHGLKEGLSPEEIKNTLKAQQGEQDPAPPLWKRIVAWVILIALAAGGFWWYKSSQSVPSPSRAAAEDAAPIQVKAPAFKVTYNTPPAVQKSSEEQRMNQTAPAAKPQVQSQPVPPAAPLPGEQVFRLKDGRTITGRVIGDDPVYYTVKTSGGREEIVIKEDLAG